MCWPFTGRIREAGCIHTGQRLAKETHGWSVAKKTEKGGEDSRLLVGGEWSQRRQRAQDGVKALLGGDVGGQWLLEPADTTSALQKPPSTGLD